MDMVYRKALRLNSNDVAAKGIGGVVNLASNDVKKLERLPITMHGIWEGPLQVPLYQVPLYGVLMELICPAGNQLAHNQTSGLRISTA